MCSFQVIVSQLKTSGVVVLEQGEWVRLKINLRISINPGDPFFPGHRVATHYLQCGTSKIQLLDI